MRKSFKILGYMALSVSILLGCFPVGAQAANDPIKKAVKQGKQKFDAKEGSYHAYFLFQENGSWVYRNPYFDKNAGILTDNWNSMLSTFNVQEPFVTDGEIMDAEIAGNGTYTVGVFSLNECINDTGELTVLGFSTDIPYNDQIKFSNVSVEIDGVVGVTQEEAYLDPDAQEAPHTMSVNVVNTWKSDYESPTLMLPRDSVKITFDVSGFDYDHPDGGNVAQESSNSEEETASPAPTAEQKDESNQSGVNWMLIAGIGGVVLVILIVVFISTKKKK